MAKSTKITSTFCSAGVTSDPTTPPPGLNFAAPVDAVGKRQSHLLPARAECLDRSVTKWGGREAAAGGDRSERLVESHEADKASGEGDQRGGTNPESHMLSFWDVG